MPRTRMESRRNTGKERKKDNMEQKKREENEIPGVIASQESFQEPVKKRSKLILPFPQISESGLEEGPSHIDPESSFQGAPQGSEASKEELKEKVKSLDKQMEIASDEDPRIRAKMLKRELKRQYSQLDKIRHKYAVLESESRAVERQMKILKKKQARQDRKESIISEKICTLQMELANRQLLLADV